MPTPPDGTPWWAWLIYGVIVIGLPTVAVALIQQWRKVSEIKDQVKNSHTESNLREDVDEAKLNASLAKEAAHRVERLVEDMLRTLRAVEHAIDRRDGLHAAAMTELREDLNKTTTGLDQHLQEIPQILDQAFARHDAEHHP